MFLVNWTEIGLGYFSFCMEIWRETLLPRKNSEISSLSRSSLSCFIETFHDWVKTHGREWWEIWQKPRSMAQWNCKVFRIITITRSCICLSLEVRHSVGFQKITDNTIETRANALFPFLIHFSCLHDYWILIKRQSLPPALCTLRGLSGSSVLSDWEVMP